MTALPKKWCPTVFYPALLICPCWGSGHETALSEDQHLWDQFVHSLPISFSNDFASSSTLSPSEINTSPLQTICLSRHHKNLHPSRQDFKACCEPAQPKEKAAKCSVRWWCSVLWLPRGRKQPTEMLRSRKGGSTDFIRSGPVSSEEAKQANSIPHEHESGDHRFLCHLMQGSLQHGSATPGEVHCN